MCGGWRPASSCSVPLWQLAADGPCWSEVVPNTTGASPICARPRRRCVQAPCTVRPRTRYAKRWRRSGVSPAWARLFFLFGPHEPPGRLVSELAAGLVAGRVTSTSEGRQERDFLHVADAGNALAQLLDGTVTGAVNVASGECVPVR